MRSTLIVAVGMALLVSGCGKKAEGQTVAVVNGEEITAAELNAELSNAKLPENLDKEEARSRVLQALIDRRLLAQYARSEGLDKSPEFLNRQRRMTEDLLINMLATRKGSTAQLPSPQEVQRFEASRPGVFSNRERWNLEQLRFAMPADEKVQAQIARTKSLEELASVLSQNGISYTRARNQLDTAIIPHDLYARISTLPPGEPFIVPVGEQAVASSIVSREPAPLTGEQARPAAVALIRREQSAKVMQDRLKTLRQSAEIDYQEGYSPPREEKPTKPN